jgi:hypothetical protein
VKASQQAEVLQEPVTNPVETLAVVGPMRCDASKKEAHHLRQGDMRHSPRRRGVCFPRGSHSSSRQTIAHPPAVVAHNEGMIADLVRQKKNDENPSCACK